MMILGDFILFLIFRSVDESIHQNQNKSQQILRINGKIDVDGWIDRLRQVNIDGFMNEWKA